MNELTRVGILISGRGSNMEALLRAAAEPGYPAEMAIVLSNRPDAPGLAIAETMGAKAMVIDHRPFGRDRAAHEAAMDAALREHRTELVCLAGYMRSLTPWLVGRWQGRMLNIHPSLLPALKGLDTHARAIAQGHQWHGCTVHLVTDAVDEGPILAQAMVPILPDDTAETLATRVLAQEHALYPRIVRQFIEGGMSPATLLLAAPAP